MRATRWACREENEGAYQHAGGQRSPNSTTRQTKGSVVCTTVTNTLVQIAISTLPARADGAAAGSGQQGRSSSEGRGAVVQDAEGSKQQRGSRGHPHGTTHRLQ